MILQQGARVRFTSDVDRYPHFIVPVGSTGIVMPMYPGDGVILIKMDQTIEGMEEWDNEFQVSLDEDDDPSEFLSFLA